jgi:hypothetical protein
MTDYLAVYESDAEGWSAYVPDVPGCVATAATRGEAELLIREALGAACLHGARAWPDLAPRRSALSRLVESDDRSD